MRNKKYTAINCQDCNWRSLTVGCTGLDCDETEVETAGEIGSTVGGAESTAVGNPADAGDAFSNFLHGERGDLGYTGAGAGAGADADAVRDCFL
jgi:hypothetical protein